MNERDQEFYNGLDLDSLRELKLVLVGELAGISRRIAEENLDGLKALHYERRLLVMLAMVKVAIGRKFRRRKKLPAKPGKLPQCAERTFQQITLEQAGVRPIERLTCFRPKNNEWALREVN